MACATPVVASPLAVSALKANTTQDCLAADSPAAFAEAILRLLDEMGSLAEGDLTVKFVEDEDWATAWKSSAG